MEEPTKMQKKVLAFLKSYLEKEGMPPTRNEISANFGWKSATAAQCHLKLLEKKGLISMTKRKSRAIQIT